MGYLYGSRAACPRPESDRPEASSDGRSAPRAPALETMHDPDPTSTPALPTDVADAVCDLDRAVALRRAGPAWALASGQGDADAWTPPLAPATLGDPAFRRDLGVDYAYVAGAMANGIASVELVEAVGRAGMLGFFGAAGLDPDTVAAAIDRLGRALPDGPCGFNLIHSPNEPALEDAIGRLYERRGVRLVEASAFLDLTPAIVRYRLQGLRRGPDGRVIAQNRVVAKVSRVEVATKFWSPAPAAIVAALRAAGDITPDEAALAAEVPLAEDVTAEADSGGHTDNRPALALVPTLVALRDRLQAEHRYATPLRVGAAGGIGTPAAVAAAFAMGAAYVVTGSINQACVESGSSDRVRAMLAACDQADVTMAPAADMFEMGVKVQVLKRGTMFPMRATKLYDLYLRNASLDTLAPGDRNQLETSIFRKPIDDVRRETETYWQARDPRQVDRMRSDPKHAMALVFQWYLGQSSRWANAGEPTRAIDYQVWCGPAMGAFNEWTRGTPLAEPTARTVGHVARNLLYNAALTTRLQWLRAQGAALAIATPPLDEPTLNRRLTRRMHA